MPSYAEEVRRQFELIDDDDLRQRIHSGNLTDEATQVAREILRGRGASADQSTESISRPATWPPTEKTRTTSFPIFLLRCFNGKESLFAAWWTLGWKVGICALVPYFILVLLGDFPLFRLVGIVALLAMGIFESICVWRCARNTPSCWKGVVARGLVVLCYLMPILSFLGGLTLR
jgi:hypothetical protein